MARSTFELDTYMKLMPDGRMHGLMTDGREVVVEVNAFMEQVMHVREQEKGRYNLETYIFNTLDPDWWGNYLDYEGYRGVYGDNLYFQDPHDMHVPVL